MAYEIIRKTEFPGLDDGAGYRVEILEESGTAFTGENDAELQLAAEPLVATYQMGDLPWGPRILNVELHLLNEDTLLQNIRGGDEEQYRLRLTKGTWDGDQAWGSRVTSGAVQWVCKIRPKKTQRMIQDRVARQVIQADDGLEQLQYYAFLDGSGEVFTGRSEIGDIIHTILNKLGLSLGFKHITNWYLKTGNNDNDVDTLTNNDYGARIDQEHLYERVREQSGGIRLFGKLQKQMRNLLKLVESSREPEDDPPSCWDVLNLILEEWQLVLYQAEDGWWIEQAAERHLTLAPKVWKYNSAGALDPSYPTTETLGLIYDESAGDYHQIGETKEWQMPAYTYARVRYQHDAVSEDLIPSNGFRDWDSATGYPRGWLRNSTSVALDPEQRQILPGSPGMMYDNALEQQLQWSDIFGDADYMYCQTPEVIVTAGDVMTFEFDALYTFANPFADLYQFVAYAQVLEVNSGNYLSGTNDDSTGAAAVGNWSTNSDNRIDLFRVSRATSGNTSPVLSATIETSTDLGLPTGACEFKVFLYKGTDFGFRVPFASNVYFLDRLVWGPPAIIYQPQDAEENEETIRQSNVVAAQSGIEALPDRVFFFGSGPTASSASRLTYDSTDEYPTDGKLALDSGAGTGIEHASMWLVEFLKLRRLGPLVYSRTMRVTSNVCYEGQHHLREGSNYYYAHRLKRLYRGGIVAADWVELRQDGATVNIEDITRDWPKKKRPDDVPATGYEFSHPFEGGDCLNEAPSEALYPMIEASGASNVLLNDNQNLSTSPNGTLKGTIGNWTWGDNGLSKTVTGTTEHVQLANDILGPTTPNRLTVFNQLRRDTASEISVWRVTAGAQTVIECKILTTGVVRLAVTDETGTTTNIDSTVTIGQDEWAGVAHSIVPSTSYTTVYAYVLNKDNEEPYRVATLIGEIVALDFTDVKMFYSNELTIRISHWLVQAWTRSMFLSEALCARTFTVDEGVEETEVVTLTDTIILRTDTGIEIWDLAGTAVDAWADATNTPGGIHCRPAWDPVNSKVFYASGEDVVSADQDGSNITVEYSAAASDNIRALRYDKTNGRLYLSDGAGAGAGDFGYLSGTPGSMSFTSLSTSYDMGDFDTYAADDLLLFLDLSDSDLYAYKLSTIGGTDVQWDTIAEANTVGVAYVPEDQECFVMESDADIFRYTVAQTGQFAASRTQIVTGSGFTTPRADTLLVSASRQLIYLVATDTDDKVYVLDYAATGQTSSDAVAIITAGDTVRGACFASIGVSPSLAAPVLVLGTETSTTVPLTWADIPGETSYVLQQSTAGATGPFTTIEGSLAADSTSHTVTGLTPVTNYWYRIRGHNAAGAGPWSNVVAATTEATPAKLLLYYDRSDTSIWKLALDGSSAVELTGLSIDMGHAGGTVRGNGPKWVGSQDLLVYGNALKVMTCDIDGFNETERFDSGVASTKWVSFDYDATNDRLYACRDTSAAGSISWGYFSDLGSATWTWNEIKTANRCGEFYLDVANSHIYNQGFPASDYGNIYRTPIGTWSATGAPTTSDLNVKSLAVDNTNNFAYGHTASGGNKIQRWPQSDLTVAATEIMDLDTGGGISLSYNDIGAFCLDESTQIGYLVGDSATPGRRVVSLDLSATGQDNTGLTSLYTGAADGIGICAGLSLIEP